MNHCFTVWACWMMTLPSGEYSGGHLSSVQLKQPEITTPPPLGSTVGIRHEHLIHLSFFTFLVHQFWTGLIWTHQTTRLFCCSKVRSLCYLGKWGFFAIRFTDKYFFLKLHNCSLLLGMLLLSPVNIAVSCAGGLFKNFFNDLMSPNIYITSDHFTIFRIFSPITFLPRSSPPRFK